jgi:hypothetical protein
MWRITTGVRDAVARGGQALRQRIAELLDARIQVTGWHTCPTCVGNGWLPDPRALPNVKVRPPGERMQALKCPTCHAYKQLPDIEVTGTLPALSTQTPTVGAGHRSASSPRREKIGATRPSSPPSVQRRGDRTQGNETHADATRRAAAGAAQASSRTAPR